MGIKKLNEEGDPIEEGTTGFDKSEREPVGLISRGIAHFLDGILLSIPLGCIIFIVAGGIMTGLEEAKLITAPLEGKENPTYDLVGEVITSSLIMIFLMFWYGWFNKKKGGSPGKLLCRMTVKNYENGENLSYRQTFFRDVLFKFILVVSIDFLLTLQFSEAESRRFMGVYFFMLAIFIAVRKDKRGLHDLLCKTQVLRRPKE